MSGVDRVGMLTLARQHGDLRLTHALAAGAGDGRVIQHLSGGPELLAAYLDGPDRTFTRGEHTLITAALTARRLGHQAPLPGALLADAAEGSLSDRHRGPDGSWAEQALVALSTGVRRDRTRTDIRCTLTALTALRSRSGGPVGYEPADYIEQQMSARLADRLGGVSLWNALLRHTCAPDDLARLARAAWSRGLCKTAVQLWIKAVLAGDRQSVRALLVSLSTIKALAPAALLWAAEHTPLSDVMVALLLKESGSTGSLDTHRRVVACLVDRAGGELTSLNGVLTTLRLGGEEEAAAALLARAVTRLDHGSLARVAIFLAALTALRNDLEPEPFRRHQYTWIGFHPATRADLPRAVRARIADDALAALLAGEPAARVDLGDARGVAELLRCLHTARANEALAVLLSRNPAAHVPLDEPDGVARLFSAFVDIGESEAAAALLARDPAACVDLTDPAEAAHFLSCFSGAGVTKAVTAMIARNPAAHVRLTDAFGVAELLTVLRPLGELDSAATLLVRQPASHVDLEREENGLDDLVTALNEAGAHAEAEILESRGLALIESQATTDLDMFASSLRPPGVAVTEQWVHTLLARIPIEEIDLSDPRAVACLLRELRDAPDSGALAALLDRAPESHADLTDAVGLNELWYALDQVNATSAATGLRARAAREIPLVNTSEVARLLEGLRTERYVEPLVVLLARAPEAHVALADPGATAALLSELQHVQLAEAVAALLARDPASAADLSRTTARGVQSLMGELRFAGAEEDAGRLAGRAADAGLIEPEGLVRFGRNADGSPTAPWGWPDVLETA